MEFLDYGRVDCVCVVCHGSSEVNRIIGVGESELRYRHMTVGNSTCECRVMSADFYR